MKVLVTGSNGRLGRAAALNLAKVMDVRLAAREQPVDPGDLDAVAVGEINEKTDWSRALAGVTAVVHCAAKTRLSAGESDAAFFAANEAGTRTLARQAAAAGVRRMVLISSMSVNGKHSDCTPFTPHSAVAPGSAYARSKLGGEVALQTVAEAAGMDAVIIRPPRIVWPDLDGNLAQLGILVRRGIPLPFGALHRNARSSVIASDLVAGITASVSSKAARGETLLLADPRSLSTVEMLEWIGVLVGRKPRLFSVPPSVLRAIVRLMPRKFLGDLNADDLVDELTRDLRIESASSWRLVGITPAASTS